MMYKSKRISSTVQTIAVALLFFICAQGYSVSEPVGLKEAFIKSSAKGVKKQPGNLLSLNFQTIPVRAALQILARFSKVNIVVNDAVTGDLTLRLDNVTWQYALKIILQAQGLVEKKIGGTYIIATRREMEKREQDALQAQKKMEVLEPLQSALIQINYGKAIQIAGLLKGAGHSILSKRGTVSVDERTNTLWVQDTTQKLVEIRKLVKRFDVPVRQVLIEAKIVNIDKQDEKQLGISWGLSKFEHLGGSLDSANNITNNSVPSSSGFTKFLNIDLPAASVGQAGGAASFGMALTKLGGEIMLDLELSALQTNGEAKIIASPRLITANQREAVIESGEEIPYQEASSSGATAIAFKKAVLSLRVVPQITPDNRIILDLKVNQDKPGPKISKGVPSIDTREIQTQVLVNNGETIVLGGIFQKSTSNNIERVPFLADIPFFGHLLFEHSQKETRQTELLIFITPKIIKGSLYKQQ